MVRWPTKIPQKQMKKQWVWIANPWDPDLKSFGGDNFQTCIIMYLHFRAFHGSSKGSDHFRDFVTFVGLVQMLTKDSWHGHVLATFLHTFQFHTERTLTEGTRVTCDTTNPVTCSSHKCDAKMTSLVAVQPLKNKKKWWVGGTSWCLGTSTPLGFPGGWDKGLGDLGLGQGVRGLGVRGLGAWDHEHRVEHHDVWVQAHL